MNPTLPEHVTTLHNGKTKATGGTLEVKNPLGQKFTLNISSIEDGYDKMRVLGTRGWSTDVPIGGIFLPFAMADGFDWSLIGGRYYEFDKTADGETEHIQAVEHQGHTYYARRKEAGKINGKNMPAMIRYTRGAKSTDPESAKQSKTEVVKEGYVVLITFRGKGPIIPAFMKP